MSFVHLHTHSHYSLLDGLGTIPLIVAEAKKLKMPAIALTDHGALYGAIEFYQECIKSGIKPIIGIEMYLTEGSLTDRSRDAKPYHIVLLASSLTGYNNLLKLTTKAHLDGFYYRPRCDWDTLASYHEGLIALTGCLNGPLSRPILEKDSATLTRNVKKLVSLFGKDNVFLELQLRPSMPDQARVNSELKQLSAKYGIGLVATNDVHYIHEEDANAHDILICLQTKHKQRDRKRMSYIGENYSLLSGEQMAKNFRDCPDALRNTLRIAERCNVEIELGKINLPSFTIPQNKSADDYLRELCYQGVHDRYQHSITDASQELITRLDYELDVIRITGFADYFLIVQDFINWAKNNNILVGPGRGSAAGSLVSYLIGITNIDPLAYGLLFERFLNPERISMPDIDVDFADTGRDRVLHYVESKYGKDRVAQIVTFGTMAARVAVRDVGRVMDYTYSYCDRIAKLIPPFTTIADSLKKVDELRNLYTEDEAARQLLDMAQKVEGVARHTSTHACAVIITNDPLINHVPLQYSSSDPDAVISQYSMHAVEDLGLLKIDFLGLKNLTILQTAVELIQKTQNRDLTLESIPLDDTATFELLQRGDTTGIFQLESSGMTRYLKKLKPTEIEDIIAMVSLYRPGPMEFIEDFIAGKHGRRTTTYLHPKLAEILHKTYGIAVYQEQVLQIARDLAGFTYGEADILRRAVGKKIKKLLVEQSEKMIKGMIANGISQKTAEQIWDFILPFARYGFNRSHAASYAMIAYQTAYLKTLYPVQFMAALMTADQDSIEKVAKQVRECAKMNITVLPPDINESDATFTVVLDPASGKVTNCIRFGLNAVKNVGRHISTEIIRERNGRGKYTGLENFLMRIHDKDLNKKTLESLIKCGALDSLADRSVMLANIENLLTFNKKNASDAIRKQENLFSDLPLASALIRLQLDSESQLSPMQKLAYEKEMLGLYISEHPFQAYAPLLHNTTPLSRLHAHMSDRQMLTVAGIVSGVKKIVTRGGKPMIFATLEDSTDSVEIIVFPAVFEQNPAAWKEHTRLVVRGRTSDKDGVPKIIAEQIEVLTDEKLDALKTRQESSLKLWLTLPSGFDQSSMRVLSDILREYSGKMGVYIIINNGQKRTIKTNLRVRNSKDMLSRLAEVLGVENISIVS